MKIKSKFSQQYSHKNPQKNVINSEKVYLVSFVVFSRLLSAPKCRFERFISQRLVHVRHCIMLMERLETTPVKKIRQEPRHVQLVQGFNQTAIQRAAE